MPPIPGVINTIATSLHDHQLHNKQNIDFKSLLFITFRLFIKLNFHLETQTDTVFAFQRIRKLTESGPIAESGRIWHENGIFLSPVNERCTICNK